MESLVVKFSNYSQICLKENVTLVEELKLVGSIRNLLLDTKYTGITTTTEVFVITAILAAVTVGFQEVQLIAIVTDTFLFFFGSLLAFLTLVPS